MIAVKIAFRHIDMVEVIIYLAFYLYLSSSFIIFYDIPSDLDERDNPLVQKGSTFCCPPYIWRRYQVCLCSQLVKCSHSNKDTTTNDLSTSITILNLSIIVLYMVILCFDDNESRHYRTAFNFMSSDAFIMQ